MSSAAWDLSWACSGLSRKDYFVWVKPDPSRWSATRGNRPGPDRWSFRRKRGRQLSGGLLPASVSDCHCRKPSFSPPYFLHKTVLSLFSPNSAARGRERNGIFPKERDFFSDPRNSLPQRHLRKRQGFHLGLVQNWVAVLVGGSVKAGRPWRWSYAWESRHRQAALDAAIHPSLPGRGSFWIRPPLALGRVDRSRTGSPDHWHRERQAGVCRTSCSGTVDRGSWVTASIVGVTWIRRYW